MKVKKIINLAFKKFYEKWVKGRCRHICHFCKYRNNWCDNTWWLNKVPDNFMNPPEE